MSNPGLTCAQCYLTLKETSLENDPNSGKKPKCWFVECSYSELSLLELGDWLNFFKVMKSEFITQNNLGLYLLKAARGLSPDVLQVFLELEGVLKKHQQEELEARQRRNRVSL